MPESPRVRFTRQRAVNVFGDRGRLVGGKGKRKRKRKYEPPHRFIYWRVSRAAVCSCRGWWLPAVNQEEGRAAWRAHTRTGQSATPPQVHRA